MLIDSKIYVYHMNIMKYKQTSTILLMLPILYDAAKQLHFSELTVKAYFSKNSFII